MAATHNIICSECGAQTDNIHTNDGLCSGCRALKQFNAMKAAKSACNHYDGSAVFVSSNYGIKCVKCNEEWQPSHPKYHKILMAFNAAKYVAEKKKAEEQAAEEKVLKELEKQNVFVQAKQEVCGHLFVVTSEVGTAEKVVLCTKCLKTWAFGQANYYAVLKIAEDTAKKKQSTKSTGAVVVDYWNKNVQPGKIVPIDGDPKKHKPILFAPQYHKAQDTSLSQEILMHIGMMSGCNVSIQHFVQGGMSCDYRLLCKTCKEAKPIESFASIRDGDAESIRQIDEFCLAHRHGAGVPIAMAESMSAATVGRKYRED